MSTMMAGEPCLMKTGTILAASSQKMRFHLNSIQQVLNQQTSTVVDAQRSKILSQVK